MKLLNYSEYLEGKAPKGAMTADLLSKIKSGKSEIIDFLNEHGNLQFVRNTKGRYEKFPLTDIQNSYVVGRNTMYELGGVACHGYIEMSFDKVLDIKRLEIAWNKVIQKHDMLRAIVSNSGYQIVQEAVVQLKKSVKENSQSVAKVLFHAGTGTLTPYNALLSYIEKDSKENEAIILRF